MTDSEKFHRFDSLKVGEIGVLQHLNRNALNGLIAEVTGELKVRMLYSLTNHADSETCMAYKVCIPGYPKINDRIDWCVKAHQLRRIDKLDDSIAVESVKETKKGVGVTI